MAWADEFTAALSGNPPGPQPQYPYWYLSLLKQGVPAAAALSIVNNPSYGEGDSRGSSDWPYAYRGYAQERALMHQPQRDQPLADNAFRMLEAQPRSQDISYQTNGGPMPPWNTMTPQQQQMLLQMMMSRGTAGMQFPGQQPPNPYGAGQQLPGMGGIQTAPGFNPLANQAQQMNPMMLQYLMGLQGGGNGMQQPTLADLLQMRGTGMGL